MKRFMAHTEKNYGKYFYRCPLGQQHPRSFIWESGMNREGYSQESFNSQGYSQDEARSSRERDHFDCIPHRRCVLLPLISSNHLVQRSRLRRCLQLLGHASCNDAEVGA
ncbi:zinc finger BED domain-containing protein 5 [Striga asiatica]|uniref:Zinc finger BED domain-containing protein 5 n=1 Tax=Striga asiatica TaxID=4170 RepID=A0A5A7QY02_STRAF|nr:zinc finger BED domain-containing protein 5 [Striga asiatica]